MPPIDVLLMIHSLGHGGSERQLTNTALELDRSRFNPHVASVLGGYQADALRRAGIPVLHLPLKSFVGPGVVRIVWQLRRYIQENRIRLVHPFDYTLSLLGMPVAKICPGVVALSSQRCYMGLVPSKYQRPLLLMHRMADGVVANCEAMKRHLSADFSYPAERIHVCYNGIDTSRFFPGAVRENGPLVIGTVCVLRPEKNVGQLLEAFAGLWRLRPEIKLVIVGSGPEREKLVAKSRELGIADACTFQPSTPDVPSVLRSIDIFVHPSLSEGLPNGVMEAMACGCIVVASNVGGCVELIEEGETGFLTRPADLESLIAGLTAAVRDYEARGHIGAAAAARMKEFSIARAAAGMQNIYQSFFPEASL